jgi:hyaluronan synthase
VIPPAIRAIPASRRPAVLLVLLLLVGGVVWASQSVVALVEAGQGNGNAREFAIVYVGAFLLLAWQTTLAYLERPVRLNVGQWAWIDRLRVTVNVPVHNEAPTLLAACLWSLLGQTRLPQRVQVVVNGCSIEPYYRLLTEWQQRARALGVWAEAVQIEAASKRLAHLTTFLNDPADIFVTVDSDTVLDRNALAEGLKPFVDPRVQSVAGVAVALNWDRNLLTRLTNLWFVTFQVSLRSSLSTLGSVLVNSGALAFYRSEVVREGADGYAHETFLGRPVTLSDDSLLTTLAKLRGRTVQQPTCFAFTVLPERVGHHLRQQLRWMRGSFIRSWWRMRYLPLGSYAYWMHFAGWVNFVLSTIVFATLFVVRPAIDRRLVPSLLIIPVLVGYATALKYLLIRRDDEQLASQLGTFLLAPLVFLWSFIVLRPLRLYAITTCLSTGWGTRTVGVEVTGAAPTHVRQRRWPHPDRWQLAAVTGVAGCVTTGLHILNIL